MINAIKSHLNEYYCSNFQSGMRTVRAYWGTLSNSEASTFEKTGRLFSNILSFASFFKLSKRSALIVTLFQAPIQAVLNFYASYKTSQEIKEDKWKTLPAASQVIAGALALTPANGCFQAIKKIVNPIVNLMQYTGNSSQILEQGYEKASFIASRLIR